MQVFLTVFSGVLVFVIGQIFIKLVIDPVHQFKRIISDISLALIQYANVWHSPDLPYEEDKELLEATGEFRKLASLLNASRYLIPIYNQTSIFFFLPEEKALDSVNENLIALSNLLQNSEDPRSGLEYARKEYEQKIRSILKIKTYD
jgi:hypothetical protein